MEKYDYLVVGAGLFGAVFARLATDDGKKCKVIERRNHIAGNAYTHSWENINVHYYGAHIFHTSNEKVWNFVNRFVPFNHYINSPIANYNGQLYNLPFNMNTFYQLWGTKTPQEAQQKIEEQKAEFAHIKEPQNLEQQALILGGRDIYEKLIKGYSEKQWGMKAIDIPSFIIRRLPFRFTFDNNYFNDPHQGIPKGGYTKLCEKLLENVDVQLNTDFFKEKKHFSSLAKKVIYTGTIDAYFDYCFGQLQYRSLRFDHQLKKGITNFQGNAVVNYTDASTPYTRIIEHKHFEFGNQADTVITFEYPSDWKPGDEPYYPINDVANNALYEKYKTLVNKELNVVFGGRLAEYKYYDMDKVIERALSVYEQEKLQ
ncbi:MAG: UDP-galactopyranose mutase [Bacteroidales bacterium]|jgi:UDP-galactopyranose mutase|nr:UDP-galactopyranose mutase [Bacteroidales bacterium]